MAAGTGSSDDAGVENIYEKFGGVCPLEALKDIYEDMSNDIFKVRARIKGTEHEDMLTLTDGYMTAWMLYQRSISFTMTKKLPRCLSVITLRLLPIQIGRI